MQLKFGRDFFVRDLRASDANEVKKLAEKDVTPDKESLTRVLLNSNGVVIGVFQARGPELRLLQVNSNFLKQEVRDVVYDELKAWLLKHGDAKLTLATNVLSSDWKSYFKKKESIVDWKND